MPGRDAYLDGLLVVGANFVFDLMNEIVNAGLVYDLRVSGT
jgi:hypothetical protein